MTDDAVLTRRREIGVEHPLLKLSEYVHPRQPGVLASIDSSLDHLGDRSHDDTKDDEAVREIARRMIAVARHAPSGV